MIAQPVVCRCGEDLTLLVDMAHGRDVSFCLACIGPGSCGYHGNRITLDNPTEAQLALETERLITALRSTPPAGTRARRAAREVMPMS